MSPGDAVRCLRAPGGAASFSSLLGGGVLLVDLRGDSRDECRPDELAALVRRVPAPAVAIAPEELTTSKRGTGAAVGDPLTAQLAAAFDVVVGDAELESILHCVTRTPLAATALCELLRLGPALDMHAALLAESLVYSTLQSGPEYARWLAGHERRETPESEPGPAVDIERDGAALDVVLNRPRSRNAFSAAMRDALCEALEVAAADASIATVRLSGRGACFSSGGDLREFGSLADPATAHLIRSTRNAARLLADLGDRVHVRVHGACIGAGVELPAFAARVIAAADSSFELPELSMGLVPGAGGTVGIARRIGRQRTALIALGGARIDAATAARWGLVDSVE